MTKIRRKGKNMNQSTLEPKLNSLLTEFREELQHLYGSKFLQIVLYGSQARNQATTDSDIDVAIILKFPISPPAEIFHMGAIKSRLSLQYDELLSVIPISEEDFRHKSTPLLNNIRREGIAL
jgi:predicted nucleotidyltransferase